jgi:hypothetical protein
MSQLISSSPLNHRALPLDVQWPIAAAVAIKSRKLTMDEINSVVCADEVGNESKSKSTPGSSLAGSRVIWINWEIATIEVGDAQWAENLAN